MRHLFAALQEEGLGTTMVARRQVAEKQLCDWKDRRASRLSQVEELQVRQLVHVLGPISHLRTCKGLDATG